MYIVSPIDNAVIPNARSPRPGTSAQNPTHLAPPNTSPPLGPGTFDMTSEALLITHIIINYPTILGNAAINCDSDRTPKG